ncbi:MAG: VCBS repeat-containing protein [Planctomycetes bacterium]|nr:VCBS repeat-containing protein [Planctomycetota bacterium]
MSIVDVTEESGVGDTGYGIGCAIGDYDNDGRLDLYVTNYGPNVLYRNNGDGTFSDVTAAAGVGDPR